MTAKSAARAAALSSRQPCTPKTFPSPAPGRHCRGYGLTTPALYSTSRAVMWPSWRLRSARKSGLGEERLLVRILEEQTGIAVWLDAEEHPGLLILVVHEEERLVVRGH